MEIATNLRVKQNERTLIHSIISNYINLSMKTELTPKPKNLFRLMYLYVMLHVNTYIVLLISC